MAGILTNQFEPIEITILGIWSVALFLIELVVHIPTDIHHVFELIHFSLFLLAVFFIALVVLMAILSSVIFWYWENLELRYESK